MKTYIALLRGINVSGKNIIKMKALSAAMAELNFLKIETYIQSGNFVFQYKNEKTDRLSKMISEKIKVNFRLDITSTVLTKEELKHLIENNPFLKQNTMDEKYLHITILKNLPEAEQIQKLNTLQSPSEKIILVQNVAYLYCPEGYGKSKLSNNNIESKFKTSATTRNWKTMKTLLNMCENK